LNYKINIFKKKIIGILRDSGQRCTKILGSCQPSELANYQSSFYTLLNQNSYKEYSANLLELKWEFFEWSGVMYTKIA
jgi:hypothetical protein